MKSRIVFILSFGVNAALAVMFVILWRDGTKTVDVPLAVPMVAASVPQTIVPVPGQPLVSSNAPAVVVNSLFHWRAIESADFRQYIANLRAVGCPEDTIRDIIVAEIEQLYARKDSGTPSVPPPWHNADRRRAENNSRAGKAAALRTEKRALIKELIGYEWDNSTSEAWHEEDFGAFLLGFLPDLKAPQLIAIVEKYKGLASEIKNRANDILIEEDRAQLRKLYEGLVAEATQLLTPADLEEVGLRIQALHFLGSESIRWDGVAISGPELREFARLSKAYKDVWQDEFLGFTSFPNEHEQALRREAFEKEVSGLLGPQRYAGYQRAQNGMFRELFDFSKEHNLPEAAPIKIYDGLRAVQDELNRVNKDGSLSPEQRTASLTAFKTALQEIVSSRLGSAYGEYLQGPGRWLEEFPPAPTANARESVP